MLKIETMYGTPWCSDCRRTKRYLGEQRIDYKWIDIDKDEQAALYVESVNNGKRKVPTIVFSDGSILVEPTNAELAEKLNLTTSLDHDFHDVVIIGGGLAGLTAALYAARDGLDVVVIEKSSLGGQASYTEMIENFPGFPDGISGDELSSRIVQQCMNFGVEFLRATEVVQVMEDNNHPCVKLSNNRCVGGHSLIITTGSKYKKLEVEGERELIGYKIHFCSTCDGPFYKDKNLAVIGGGNSAFEESLFLSKFANHVTIYGRSSNWKASKSLIDKVESIGNISLKLNSRVNRFIVGDKKTLAGIEFTNVVSEEIFTTQPDGVFIYIGYKPNVSTIEGIIDVDEQGFIKTNDAMMTNIKGIFAAGDVRRNSTKQAVSASGEGASVALHVRNYLNSVK
ncbi:MAG: FAD-dependent oxidoreductase [Candidatus Heimdallarchaeota archaeon]|nr:FAD-dependent oxidoreductase [Candidatus Heimdallarchaeota archaeon]MDH5645549.1 FAD-dependent oxidoreductase [Candidatus Heimdallarchaeota archaeon]